MIKKDYIYIGIILISAILFIYFYKTKPVPPVATDTQRKIDSLNWVITKKDSAIIFHQNKYHDLKTAINARERPNYQPIPITERNRAIIDIATK